jgi:hypothetical protein
VFAQFVPIHGSSRKNRHDDDGKVRIEVHPGAEEKPVSPRCRRCEVSRTTTAVPALQLLREQLDPDVQRMYPELLTAVAPPTQRDVIDVLEQLEALGYGGGRNTCDFAMEVISSLVAMIDVDALEPMEPRKTVIESDAPTDNMAEIVMGTCITNEQVK